MKVVSQIAELQAARRALSGTVGFVPTMGALHAGHRALITQAAQENDHVVASIFVNPMQFSATEDLSRYPRPVERDLNLLAASGVAFVFMPDAATMYPAGFQTSIEVADVSQMMEGAQRPGHFRGVATVVGKLFNLVQPDRAYFGQKDAQQIAVIRRMVADLNFPLTVVTVPTVRDADGLALSSRNVFLSEAERAAAPIIYQALQSGAELYLSGRRDPDAIRAVVIDRLAHEPLITVDYGQVVDRDTMAELHAPLVDPALIMVAVRLGGIRLIDNWPLD